MSATAAVLRRSPYNWHLVHTAHHHSRTWTKKTHMVHACNMQMYCWAADTVYLFVVVAARHDVTLLNMPELAVCGATQQCKILVVLAELGHSLLIAWYLAPASFTVIDTNCSCGPCSSDWCMVLPRKLRITCMLLVGLRAQGQGTSFMFTACSAG